MVSWSCHSVILVLGGLSACPTNSQGQRPEKKVRLGISYQLDTKSARERWNDGMTSSLFFLLIVTTATDTDIN